MKSKLTIESDQVIKEKVSNLSNVEIFQMLRSLSLTLLELSITDFTDLRIEEKKAIYQLYTLLTR